MLNNDTADGSQDTLCVCDWVWITNIYMRMSDADQFASSSYSCPFLLPTISFQYLRIPSRTQKYRIQMMTMNDMVVATHALHT